VEKQSTSRGASVVRDAENLTTVPSRPVPDRSCSPSHLLTRAEQAQVSVKASRKTRKDHRRSAREPQNSNSGRPDSEQGKCRGVLSQADGGWAGKRTRRQSSFQKKPKKNFNSGMQNMSDLPGEPTKDGKKNGSEERRKKT